MAAAAVPAPAAAAEPAWKSMPAAQAAAIEKARAEAAAKGEIDMKSGGTFGSICRFCTKPNSVSVAFCTGCSFPASKWDIQRLPDNIFLEMVKGKDVGAKVHVRNEQLLVFDDKFPVTDHHLDVIPTAVYDDITKLNATHIPLLEAMYAAGKQQLLSRNIAWLKGQDIDAFISAGYNFPVSVKHLHIHVMLPPFKHNKVLQYPRWHSHAKVMRDLKAHGKVILYETTPNDAEGKAEYDRAMANQDKAKALIEALAAPAAPAAK